MKKTSVKVAFKMKIPALLLWAESKLSFVHRDIAEFSKYGITDERLAGMKNMIREFMEFPTDADFEGIQMISTKARDALASTIRIQLTSILTRVSNKYGTDSPYYRSFGTKRLSALRGPNLILSAEIVHMNGLQYLDELAEEGLTEEILSELSDKITAYLIALFEQKDAVVARYTGTEKRVEMANEIYKTFVKICKTGKTIWENENEAKYNDYVIYKTPSHKTKAKATKKETSEENADIQTGDASVIKEQQELPLQKQNISKPEDGNDDMEMRDNGNNLDPDYFALMRESGQRISKPPGIHQFE